MRIAHVSDIHIRNLKFHSEYRRVFDDFYRKLEELKVDLVVNTGDTAHTKTNISPEFVDMASQLFTEVAKRAPIINVLGNHDLNLMNDDRQDAISPVIEALGNPRVVLSKKSGPIVDPAKFYPFRFWNFGIADVEHWPRGPYPEDTVNIGLFHGSIRNCLTDSLFRMTHTEYDIDLFDGLDFVMMGDIHKRQSFRDGTIWYPGSMIQQNFGEDPDKGFLLWDIKGKDDFEVTFHELKGNRRYYTVRLDDNLTIPDLNIEQDSRIRIAPSRQLTLVEQRATEKLVKKKWNPHDIITLGVKNVSQSSTSVMEMATKNENIRLPEIQEKLIREFLRPKNAPERVMQKIIDLNRKYQVSMDQREDISRNVKWRVLKMGWSNLYNYGEGNVIDFAQIRGLTGIFGANAIGKSSLIDVITVAAYDANTKEVAKNINLVNDNKDKAVLILELLSNNDRYTIERTIERIKFGQRKGSEKEWGKTALKFERVDADGGVEKLVGESRPETERNIRRRFGTFDDFMLTSLFAQWDPMDLIMCKETERKRILYRFLDLDIFEEKGKLAREEMREHVQRLDDLEKGGFERIAKELQEKLELAREELKESESSSEQIEAHIKNLHDLVEELAAKKVPVQNVPFVSDDEIKKIGEQTNTLERDAEKLADQLLELNRQTTDLNQKLNLKNEVFLIQRKNDLDALEKILIIGQSNVSTLMEDWTRASRQSRILETVPCGDAFPTCRFLIDAFAAKAEMPEINKNLQEQREGVKQTEAAIEIQKAHVAELEIIKQNRIKLKEYENQTTMLMLKRENILLRIEGLRKEWQVKNDGRLRYEQSRKEIEENAKLDAEIEETKGAIKARTRHLKEEHLRATELHKKIASEQGILERVQKELTQITELRDLCQAFELYGEAMGKDGIALQILTQKLPVINEEINKILGSAAEFNVFIEYDKEEQSIKIYLQYGQYKSRLIELGSGAEKFLASIALRSSLLSISNLPRSNMFIIDEGFGKLDPTNLEAVQKMFDYLKSVFDHVIVISHSDLMKDMVDNTIEIVADDEGYAHVEIGG